MSGLADLLQLVLAAPQLLGQITAQLDFAVLAVFLHIKDLGPAHQLLDLLLKLRLGFEHPLLAHRFVLGGIGLHLGAVQRHMAQAHHAGRLTEPQDLHKQLARGLKVAAAELTDQTVVRLLVARKHPEGKSS